jgi:squalene-hopene/tetraprenyl-beta-curcumene cyclase
MSAPLAADRTIARGVDALIAQAELGYPEATHVLPFPRTQGFEVDSDLQSGDVFQRAVLNEALAAIHARGLRDLAALIAREADYLLAVRRPYPPGGWAYFPNLHELPADADDLAQCIRALVAAGRREAAREAAAEPLETLLDTGEIGPGLYETWILPRDGDAVHARQRWWIRHAWGRGPDCEVIANLTVALALLDDRRYAGEIKRCAARIAAMQAADGSWPSSWYHGPFYPGWVCAKALGPRAAATLRWQARLRASQRADGGWGWRETSDPLSTALGLLALDPCDPAAAAARAYLAETQQADGMWPAVLWIRMELGRAEGQVRTVLSYGSRAIGTGYALQALLRIEEER